MQKKQEWRSWYFLCNKWEMRLPSFDNWKTTLVQTTGTSPIGEITLAGTISKSRGIRRDKPRIFGQWAIVYLVAGTGKYHDARGTDIPLRAGDVILVFPEVAHSYGPEPGGIWNELYVCFRGPVFEAWREAEIFDVRNPAFHWKPPRAGLEILQPFFSQWNQAGQSMLEAVAMWQQILSRIFKAHISRNAKEHHPGWFLQAADLLERSAADDERTLRNVAESCGMGYESFRKKFTDIAGEPPARYAMARRIERARQLLARHRFTNKELAEMLGFHDEFHFAKTFKKLTGKTPRQDSLDRQGGR
jgi:AraC-like DNA-binding protein